MTPIVIAFTPNYFVPASTLVHSVLRNAKGEFEFICLMSEEPDRRQCEMLETMAGQRAKFRYIAITELPEGVYVDPRYSAAAEFRLLLPEILKEYDNVLYVDCDIIVRQDLDALFQSVALGDNLLAAVYEAPIENQSERWRALGCDPDRYFNSGFLILNLSQMRKEKTSDALMEALRTDYLEFPDQDALNQVCKGRVLPLPPCFNAIRTFHLPQYEADFLRQYSAAELSEARLAGNIHYTGGKPWNQFTVCFDLWWKEYRSLPEEIRKEWKAPLKLSLLSSLYINPLGNLLIEGLRNLYRKLRKR